MSTDLSGFGSSVSVSKTFKSNDSLGCSGSNENSLDSVRLGITTNDNGTPSFSFGSEHYTLDKESSSTNCGYAFIRTSQHSRNYPLSLDFGIMRGLGKFNKSNENSYFNFTRSDTYVKAGMSTNFDKIENIYTGIEARNGLVRGSFTVGVKHNGREFVPTCGVGMSFDMDFI
jgi:hypothetical protein